jgi:hypothetical protein
VAALALFLVMAAPAAALERVWLPPQVLNPDPENNWTNDPVVVRTVTGETVTAFLSLPNDGWTTRVLVRVRNVDGTLGPIEELTDRPAGCVLDIATDALGNVVVSWVLPDGTVQIARRPAGGTFGEPETASPGSNSMPSLTMNARGDIGLVWRRWINGTATGTSYIQGRVRLNGKGWGPVTDLSSPETPPYWGGVSGALTPGGDLVAVWTDNPDQSWSWDDRPAHVRAATLFEDGRVSRVQELSTFQGWATCPQVLSDLKGRVAAIWHEIYDDYCPMHGRTMLAKRTDGDEFGPPEEVPGTRGNASPGELAVSEDGRIGVAFGGGYGPGGNLAVGSFDEPLELVASVHGGKPAMAGGESGEIVFGPNWGPDIMTGRLRSDGSLAPPQDLRDDCAEVTYATMDVNDDGAAAVATLMPWTGELELSVDAPSAFAGPLSCDPDHAPGGPAKEPPPYVPPADPPQGTEPPEEGTEPPEEGTSPPQEGTQPPQEGTQPPSEGPSPPPEDPPHEPTPPPAPPPPGAASGPSAYGPPAPFGPSPSGPPPTGLSPADTGFAVVVDRVKRSGSGRKRTVKLHVRCGVACSLNALGLVTAKDGRILSRASGLGLAQDGEAWITLRFKLPSKLSSSKRRKATVRVSAADSYGNTLQRELRVGL